MTSEKVQSRISYHSSTDDMKFLNNDNLCYVEDSFSQNFMEIVELEKNVFSGGFFHGKRWKISDNVLVKLTEQAVRRIFTNSVNH